MKRFRKTQLECRTELELLMKSSPVWYVYMVRFPSVIIIVIQKVPFTVNDIECWYKADLTAEKETKCEFIRLVPIICPLH